MPDLKANWHGAPLWAWYGGGTVVVVGGFILWKRRQAAKAAAQTPNATGSGVDTASAGQASNLPVSSDTGWFGGSSPTGSIIGYNSDGSPVYSGFPGSSFTPPPAAPPIAAGPSGAVPPVGPPATLPMSGTPGNQYAMGQVVNAASGEKIVAELFSPVYGWLDETNIGGIYTGGGGQPGKSISQLPYGGSYPGYVASKYGVGTPAAKAELALHGTFGPGGLALKPGGGYSETNSRGERYDFGN